MYVGIKAQDGVNVDFRVTADYKPVAYKDLPKLLLDPSPTTGKNHPFLLSLSVCPQLTQLLDPSPPTTEGFKQPVEFTKGLECKSGSMTAKEMKDVYVIVSLFLCLFALN